MLPTFVVASILIGMFLASILLWALSLVIGLRWAKAANITMRRVALAIMLMTGLQAPFMLVTIRSTSYSSILFFSALAIFVNIAIPCFVIRGFFNLSYPRALQAWLPTTFAPMITVAITLFFVLPFLVEAYIASSNSMAPTLLGNHWQGTCLECGNPAYCSPQPEDYSTSEKPFMICRDHFHVTQPADRSDQVFKPDRFLVCKFLAPQRWDIVAFRFPDNPSVIYVKRLVGLPGEEITIKDGQVWADGKALEPPPALSEIKYVSQLNDFPDDLWGSPQRPAKLGDDEYFVLGDFSQHSLDSRLWQEGAPGHNPFAVPKSHMRGVVSHIYWPPSRWRSFR